MNTIEPKPDIRASTVFQDLRTLLDDTAVTAGVPLTPTKLFSLEAVEEFLVIVAAKLIELQEAANRQEVPLSFGFTGVTETVTNPSEILAEKVLMKLGCSAEMIAVAKSDEFAAELQTEFSMLSNLVVRLSTEKMRNAWATEKSVLENLREQAEHKAERHKEKAAKYKRKYKKLKQEQEAV